MRTKSIVIKQLICFISFMKKKYLIMLFLFISVFGFSDESEEIGFLLFLPNSNRFANEAQAMIRLDAISKNLLSRDLASGQICICGYSAIIWLLMVAATGF